MLIQNIIQVPERSSILAEAMANVQAVDIHHMYLNLPINQDYHGNDNGSQTSSEVSDYTMNGTTVKSSTGLLTSMSSQSSIEESIGTISDETATLHIENILAIDGNINLSDHEFCLGIVEQIRQAKDMKLLQHSEIWIGDTGVSGFSTFSKQGSKNERASTSSALGAT